MENLRIAVAVACLALVQVPNRPKEFVAEIPEQVIDPAWQPQPGELVAAVRDTVGSPTEDHFRDVVSKLLLLGDHRRLADLAQAGAVVRIPKGEKVRLLRHGAPSHPVGGLAYTPGHYFREFADDPTRTLSPVRVELLDGPHHGEVAIVSDEDVGRIVRNPQPWQEQRAGDVVVVFDRDAPILPDAETCLAHRAAAVGERPGIAAKLSRRGFRVPSMTRAVVEDIRFSDREVAVARVRVLQGPQSGRAGYIFRGSLRFPPKGGARPSS